MERASRVARSSGRTVISSRSILLATVLAAILLVSIGSVTGTITKQYSWTHREGGPSRNVSFELTVEEEYLQGYNDYPVGERFDYGSMITVNDPFVMVAALEIRAIAVRYDFDEAELALSFVQSLEYAEDNVTKNCIDYARFPLEMLVDTKGDCEDKALLYSTLLIDLGFDSVLFVIYDNNSGHMASGVAGPFTGGSVMHNGTEYFYAETTSKGFDVGHVPNDITLGDIEVVERSEPKGPYAEPEDKEDELPPWYHFITGVLLTGTVGIIIVVMASRRRRIASEREGSSEDRWNEYERMGRSDTGLNIINEQHPGPRQPPQRRRERPPPENWGYGDDRRVVRGYVDDEDHGSEDGYNPYQ